jgi:hypothetical protein
VYSTSLLVTLFLLVTGACVQVTLILVTPEYKSSDISDAENLDMPKKSCKAVLLGGNACGVGQWSWKVPAVNKMGHCTWISPTLMHSFCVCGGDEMSFKEGFY